MKHTALLLLSLLSCLFATTMDAKTRKVFVETPGTLPTLIGEQQKDKVTSLCIEGALNGTDLRFLREMAGSDYHMQPTAGRLRTLDLSRATFIAGAEAYIDKDGPKKVQGGTLTLPPFAFRHCRLEEVTLPAHMDTIGVGAFEYSSMRSIRIPEHVVVRDWAFNHCEQLASVTFPRHLVELGQNCFRDCANLRTLRIHDIEMLPYHAFEQVTGLEEIVIDGLLLHVDGWFCHNCPRLRRIEFAGVVLTTGGSPIASGCPLLSDITFSGICLPMGFGSVEDCPQMKQCTVSGIVMRSQDEDFIPFSTSTQNLSAERIQALIQPVMAFLTTGQPKSQYTQPSEFAYARCAYNLACVLGQKGMKDEALAMLRIAANHGFADYRHVRSDKDLDLLHGLATFDDIMAKMKEKWDAEHDYLNILRQAPAYSAIAPNEGPTFTYAPATDADLVRVRSFFNLDSIAGHGNEISQMKNIMYWLHDQIPHDGSGGFPANTPRNAIDLFKACKAQGRGLNCRGLALVLSELYLAMGWPARALTCQPKAYSTDPDCHVIDMVWSRSLNKWIWMDPSFAAYVADENGLLLHPGEVRQRLIDGRPLVLNEDANWNHRSKQTKKQYLDNYMAKNLYYLSAYLNNRYGVEAPDTNPNGYYTLAPKGTDAPNRPALPDEAWFWQAPKE